MPTVVILGFAYTDLPATITDIYKVYSFHRDLGHTVHIGSDIIEPKFPTNLKNLIANKSVDDQFMEFVKSEFVSKRTLVTDRDSLLHFFKTITPDDKVIFYYTGHGVEKGFKLPDSTLIIPFDFRECVFSIAKPVNGSPPQILILLDCCELHHLHLTFRYDVDAREFDRVVKTYVRPEILLLTSNCLIPAMPSESIFTKIFYALLRNPRAMYDLHSIVQALQEGIPAVRLYSSRVSEKVLWSWVLSPFVITLDHQNLILRLETAQHNK